MSGERASGRSTPRWTAAAALAAASLLAACTVGPDYKGPPEVAAGAFAQARFQRAALADVVDAPPPARWWEAVDDPLLTALIDEAFVASPTLKSAAARIRSARAQQLVNRAGLLPTGGGTASYVRARVPTGTIGQTTGSSSSTSSIPDPLALDLFSVSFDATWELDLFGGTRRAIESAGASADAADAAFADAQVQLASDIARAYVMLREAQARTALALRMVELRERSVRLTRQRRERGTASEGELQQLLDQTAQERAGVPPLRLAVDQQLDQIAILAGREPGAFDSRLAAPTEGPVVQPMPPAAVPIGDPASWLQRRPDIRSAERRLAASTATIGQNVAGYFPKVSLLGFIGTNGAEPGDLFKGMPTSVLAPSLSWSFLSIPATRARVAGAEAARDQALADYEGRVLAALQDANGSLARFGRARSALIERQAAQDASATAVQLTAQRQSRGTASLIEFYDAERAQVANDGGSAQARSEYMQAYVALQKSLGLGWGAPLPPAPTTGFVPSRAPSLASSDDHAAAGSTTTSAR